VTVAGETRKLQEPFIVYATQNPIEHEGTYPLPEAQLDRFFFDLQVDYPTMEEERAILDQTTFQEMREPQPVLSREQVLQLQGLVREVPVPKHLTDAILKLVHATRPASDQADDYVKQYVAWGAGPRASQTLSLATRALALLRGEPATSVQELVDVALPVLRHRVIPNYNATGEGITSDDIVRHLLKAHSLA